MAKRPTARILVIDNDPRVGPDLQGILDPLGYRVQIARGVGHNLLDQAITLAQRFRPHVAIVDVRLLDEYTDDRSGLALLNGLQSARSILYSAYLKPEVTREAHSGAASWVSKGESPQHLLDEVARVARETCRGDLHLDRPRGLSSPRIVEALFGPESDVPVDEVEDVLGRLFPENDEISLEVLGPTVVSPHTVPRGRSVVLKVQADGLEPVVVKLAPSRRIRDEERNYQEHARGRLVGQFYAQLERIVEFWDLGGATYNFLGSSLKALPSFADFYRNERGGLVILRPLAHFFQEVWGRHYAQPLQEKSVPLFEVYGRALRLKERLENFGHQEEKWAFPGLSVSLTNPVPWALRHANDSLIPDSRQAITHGDLHGDNLFVDSEHAWAIDFERTGPGHILRDFIELEVDIVTRLVSFPGHDLSRLYELAVVLAKPSEPVASIRGTSGLLAEPETRKALGVVAGLRRLAYEVTHYQDSREYLWGLLLDTLFVAALAAEGAPQRERALLFGSVLCERLRHWGGEWPPEDWPAAGESQTTGNDPKAPADGQM
ncbi:MAG: phosphotransferase [Anaerolineae bacterium]